MRHPQLLVYEHDSRVADLLRETARALKWTLREPRRPEAVLDLLRPGGMGVLVVRLWCDRAAVQAALRDQPADETGLRRLKELTQGLALVERVAARHLAVRTVVVGDEEDPVLAGLAWDLGADFVLFPPHPPDQLPSIVTGLMEPASRGQPELLEEG